MTTVEPEGHPFSASIRKVTGASSTTVETLVDDLRKPRTSGTKAGEKIKGGNNKSKNRAKVKNYMHRLQDEYAVDDVQQDISRNRGQAAVTDEAANNKAKMIKEINRDIEAICLGDQSPVEGASDDDMITRGAFDWHNTSGGSGNLLVPELYRTPSASELDHSSTTSHALFTEIEFNDVLESIKLQHGSKQNLDLFAGSGVCKTLDYFTRKEASGATRYQVNDSAGSHEITLYVTIFDSSFARVSLIADDFVHLNTSTGVGRTGSGLLCHPDYWEMHLLEELNTYDEDDDDGAGPHGWARTKFATLNLNPKAGGTIFE